MIKYSRGDRSGLYHVACFINLGATVVPAAIGSMRSGMSTERADAAMFVIFSASALVAAALASIVARSGGSGGGGADALDGSLAYAAVDEEEEEEEEEKEKLNGKDENQGFKKQKSIVSEVELGHVGR